MIVNTDLKFIHSGLNAVASNYDDLGGNIFASYMTRPYVTSVKHNLLDEITPGRAFSGEDYYVCIGAYNENGSSIADNVRVWLTSDSVSADSSIQLGIGPDMKTNKDQVEYSGTNIVEPRIADHFTPPANITFQNAIGLVNSILIGDLPPLTGRMFWIKRTIDPNASQLVNDNFTLNIGTSQE